MNIDDTRRVLRLTEQELAGTRKALEESKQHNKRLREENEMLKGRMHKAVGLLLPEGTTLSTNWDNYEEPGY